MKPAERILETARKEIGVTEYPPGSNKVKYNTWFYGREVSGASYPWCCAFVCWVFDRVGYLKLLRKTGGCTTLMNWFKAKGQLVPVKEARPGDVVFYQFDKDAYADHVGIVECVNKNGVAAIEGNTSVTCNDNGGAVMRRNRGWSCIMAVARPNYEGLEKEEGEMNEKDVKELVAREVKKTVDETKEKRFQRLEELPAWAREDVGTLMKKGVIQGDDRGQLDLSGDMVRLLVMAARLVSLMERAGEEA